MNRFYHYAVVFFVIACYVVHGQINLDDKLFEALKDEQDLFHVDYSSNYLYGWRSKRGFFSSFQIPGVPYTEPADKDDKKTTAENTILRSDADVTTIINSKLAATAANVETAYKSFMDAIRSSKDTHVVIIRSDVKKSLVEAAPYLPLVTKLTTYIAPDLSLYDVVTLSVNVAALTTQGVEDYTNAGAQTKPDFGSMVGQYATGIYDKLKDAFKSRFGDVKNYFSDREQTNSLPETHSIFDQVKSKMNIFGSFMNKVDAPQTEDKEEKIVTQTYVEGSQPSMTKTIVTKTYKSGGESIPQTTNGETNNINFKNKLLEDGNYKVGKIITEMKNEFNNNENSANDSGFEAYDDDNDDENMDDDDENTNDDDECMDDDDENVYVEINEEDFNKVMIESMVLQPDFVHTLDAEELLKRIDQLQKSLPYPNHNNRKTFKALIEELDIDERYSNDRVNELINVLEKITNYFILKAIENNESLVMPPTLPTAPLD